ncbi:UNVERIFIED_CONTAM: hypothetical protein RMT77_006617 [Armadillidium vulgare]
MAKSISLKRMQIEKQFSELEERLKVDGVLMTSEREGIVKKKAMDLLHDLRDGNLSAMEVLQAFQAKALELTRKINCITEFIPEAETFAKKCDELPAGERRALHGVPVSIKDTVDVKGMDSTLGLAKRINKPATSNAVLVDVLIANGAVPFCKTNISQMCLSFSCNNPVFGTTKNPHDVTRCPGGSSGGEGALIGGGGSILGVGSDLAGSIRVPSNFSGCTGIKPTSPRLSTNGLLKALAGQQGNKSCIGVMGRDVDIVSECMKILCSSEVMNKLDPKTVPIPWNESKLTSKVKLRFGYYDSLSVFPTSPGVRRAIHESKEALERAGHEVVPFDFEDAFDIFKNCIRSTMSDNGVNMTKHIEGGESVDPSLSNGYILARTPIFLKPLLKKIAAWKTSSLGAEAIQLKGCYKTYQYWKYLHEREFVIDGVLKRLEEKKIDLLLSPVYPIPAPQEEIPMKIIPACVYTFIYNYLDFPSGTLSVTKETDEDQKKLQDYPQQDFLFKLAKKATEGATGLPIGVLITGRPWQEELVCRGMMELQEALKTNTNKE